MANVDISSALTERTTSSFPLSIGTALAFETLFDGSLPVYDDSRAIPDRVDINGYDVVAINLATLYRNIVGSVSATSRNTLLVNEITQVMVEEMIFITDLLRSSTDGRCVARFYRNKFEGLQKRFPHAKLRSANTPGQQLYQQEQNATLEFIFATADNIKRAGVELCEYEYLPAPVKAGERTLIITHYPVELLAKRRYSKLDLLESHTGVLKPPALWYTKFQDGKQLAHIPFNSCMLQVFGDSQTFHPMPIAERREVLGLAEKFNWNALTTKERLKLGFEYLPNKELSKKLNSMLTGM